MMTNEEKIKHLETQVMNLQEICNNQLETIVKLFDENAKLKAKPEKKVIQDYK